MILREVEMAQTKSTFLLSFVFLLLVMTSFATAIDWSPQGNINLKSRYYIKNDPAGSCPTGEVVSGKLANGSWSCGSASGISYTAGSNLTFNGSEFALNTTGVRGWLDNVYISSYTETDPKWTANQSLYSTTATILGWNYFNASDFVISDYYLKSNPFSFYNSTDFIISDYFTKPQILGFDYYNSSDFVISDYSTNVKVDSLGNWSNDKSGYYTSSQSDNNFATIDEPLWTSNSTTVARTGTCSSGNFVQNITSSGLECDAPSGSGDITAVDTNGDYLTGGGPSGDISLLLNETILNATIDDRSGGSGDNTSWNESYANILYADISVTGDNSTWNESYAGTLYRAQSWDNFTGIPTAIPSNGDTTHFSTANQIYDWVVGLGYITSLVADTSPQLGGYLDTNGNNIGGTADEIENVYVGTNSKIYFGDGQEASVYYNGSALVISG